MGEPSPRVVLHAGSIDGLIDHDDDRLAEADSVMEALLGEAPDPPYAGAGAGAAAVGTHQSQQHQLPLPLEPAIAPPETSAADTTGSNSDSSSSGSGTVQKEEGEGRLTVGDLVRLVKGPTFLTLLGLCYLWFCASLSYYGIAFNSGNLRCVVVVVMMMVLVAFTWHCMPLRVHT